MRITARQYKRFVATAVRTRMPVPTVQRPAMTTASARADAHPVDIHRVPARDWPVDGATTPAAASEFGATTLAPQTMSVPTAVAVAHTSTCEPIKRDPDIALYRTAVDALRADPAVQLAPLSDAAIELLETAKRTLRGIADPWLTSDGRSLVPVDAWDDIDFLSLCPSTVNVGGGATMANLIGLPGSLIGNAPWDAALNGVDQRIEWTNGPALTHSTGDSIVCVADFPSAPPDDSCAFCAGTVGTAVDYLSLLLSPAGAGGAAWRYRTSSVGISNVSSSVWPPVDWVGWTANGTALRSFATDALIGSRTSSLLNLGAPSRITLGCSFHLNGGILEAINHQAIKPRAICIVSRALSDTDLINLGKLLTAVCDAADQLSAS